MARKYTKAQRKAKRAYDKAYYERNKESIKLKHLLRWQSKKQAQTTGAEPTPTLEAYPKTNGVPPQSNGRDTKELIET